MEINELIHRSPVRIFEKSINGGLKSGELGIIASRAGIGKTSVLVQLALDKLIQGKKVIHVSFTQHTQYVISWYEDIFREIIGSKNLENKEEVKNNVVKNRVLMNFNQDGMSKNQILKSLRAMITEGGFNAEAVIIDGFDFSRTSRESMISVKTFAGELDLSVWYSCTVNGESSADTNLQKDKQNIPVVVKDFTDLIDVIVLLEPRQNYITLSVFKDRDSFDTKSLAMRLDPKTLLMLEE